MNSVGGEISKRLGVASRQLSHVQRPAVEKAALIMTTAIRNKLPQRLSRVGRKGVKIGARYNVSGITDVQAVISALGPVHLL